MKNYIKYFLLFLLGAVGYGVIEILFRGYTHWSMLLTGGVAFLIIYLINQALNCSIFIKALVCCGIITLLELIVGIIVNRVYNFAVWDYTGIPLNFMGQISLRFTLCWYAIAFVILLFFAAFEKLFKLRNSENLDPVRRDCC